MPLPHVPAASVPCAWCTHRAFDAQGRRSLDFTAFQHLHYFLVNVQNSFTTFDRDRSGRLSQDELLNALKQAGEAPGAPLPLT
jgi:Ca2+-binding EF-hand superfamily protein